MSGGAWEYMASLRSETYGSSGFDAATLKAYNSKYYDEYDGSSEWTKYSKRILGDATGEMGPFSTSPTGSWYGDYASFVNSSSPWFVRGGYYGSAAGAGAFSFFYNVPGGSYSFNSFRLVLAP